MTFDVILQKQTNNGYIARPVLWPDTSVHGGTQQEALQLVRQLIRDLLTQTQLVQVEIEPDGSDKEHSWSAKAGIFQNDPTWNEFLQEMSEYRRQIDEEPA